jgi:hypothetical protein
LVEFDILKSQQVRILSAEFRRWAPSNLFSEASAACRDQREREYNVLPRPIRRFGPPKETKEESLLPDRRVWRRRNRPTGQNSKARSCDLSQEAHTDDERRSTIQVRGERQVWIVWKIA